MVELRWIDREIQRDPTVSFYHGPDREKVLQSRRIVKFILDVDATRKWYQPVRYTRTPVWSEWQDLPTVKE